MLRAASLVCGWAQLAGRDRGVDQLAERRHKLERCRYHGDAGLERWVGLGMLAHDLRMIAKVRF